MSAYASHLARLHQKTTVTASEDIFSDKGVLIAKSGTEINQKTSANLLKFKLLKPLEDSIFIANQLTPKTLCAQIIDLLNKDPYLKALHATLGNHHLLQSCCLRLQQYPILLQKLTVLDMEITHVFHQSLLSAYLAALCGKVSASSQAHIEENFLAGLVHDIGLLHIDRYILTKTETLAAQEWRKVQSHPLIGYEILKRTPDFPPRATQAVLEHHENLDGSGYPRAKNLRELSRLGQLINLLDNVIVIYNKKFKPIQHSLCDVIPILQMNMHSYLSSEVSVIFQIIKKTPPTAVNKTACNILGDLIDHAHQQQKYINTLSSQLKRTNEAIDFVHKDKDIYALQNSAINILVILNSAGLNEEDSMDWQAQPQTEVEQQNLYKEVEAMRLMQEEIIYQLKSYQKSANVFINNNPQHQFSTELSAMLQAFKNTPLPEAPQTLKQYWAS